MKSLLLVSLVLVLTSCVSNRVLTTGILIPINEVKNQTDYGELHMQFSDIKFSSYVFDFYYKNNSNDTIKIDSSSLYYVSVSEKDKKEPRVLYCINPRERIEQLNAQRDCLLNEKNPYSLEGLTFKETMSDLLIRASIGLLFGQDADDLAMQRKENKEDWEDAHNWQIRKVINELDYWHESTFFPYVIPPNTQVNQKVFFPIDVYKEELELRVVLQNDTSSFRFVQSRHYIIR